MHAVLLTIGDEILIGQIVDTNASWLGQALTLAGVTVIRRETVGDDTAAIQAVLDRAYRDADLVVVTGGLGPTHDDVTREAVADFFGVDLRHDPEVMEALAARFKARGRRMSPLVQAMAEVPDGFEVLSNSKGTAPGLWGERVENGRSQVVVLMPGVPHEMQAITTAHVLPRLRARTNGGLVHKTLLTVGEGETNLADLMGDLDDLFQDGLALAFLPALGTVRLRLTARGTDRAAAQTVLDRGIARLRRDLGDYLFGEDEDTLEAVLGRMLAKRGLSLSTAESCTGGAVAARITSVPGASRYFHGGVVAYDNAVKQSVLGISADVLAAHGAVSEPVARAMAEGVRARMGTDLGVATTGIAGPTGGTPDKPVGTIWLGYAGPDGSHAVRLQLGTDRTINIGFSTTTALNLVRRQVLRSA